ALGDRIGRITPEGVVTEFALARGTTPNGITTALDGALWFVEFGTNRIGRFAPPGVDTLPSAHRLPREVDFHPGRCAPRGESITSYASKRGACPAPRERSAKPSKRLSGFSSPFG